LTSNRIVWLVQQTTEPGGRGPALTRLEGVKWLPTCLAPTAKPRRHCSCISINLNPPS